MVAVRSNTSWCPHQYFYTFSQVIYSELLQSIECPKGKPRFCPGQTKEPCTAALSVMFSFHDCLLQVTKMVLMSILTCIFLQSWWILLCVCLYVGIQSNGVSLRLQSFSSTGEDGGWPSRLSESKQKRDYLIVQLCIWSRVFCLFGEVDGVCSFRWPSSSCWALFFF